MKYYQTKKRRVREKKNTAYSSILYESLKESLNKSKGDKKFN